MIKYSLMRVGIFVVVLVLLFFLGLRSWPLLFLAAIVSAILSLVLLGNQREQFASKLEAKVEKRRERARQMRGTGEDDEDDELDE